MVNKKKERGGGGEGGGGGVFGFASVMGSKGGSLLEVRADGK